MTANQIAYSKVVEDRRHNKVFEGETYRHNVETEGIGWQQAAAALTSARAAMVSAGAQQLGAQASILGAQTRQQELQETKRHNSAQESLTSIYNRGMLAQGWTNQGVQAYNAAMNGMVGLRNAATRRAELVESTRHNIATEGIALDRLPSEKFKLGAEGFNSLTQGIVRIAEPIINMIGGNK